MDELSNNTGRAEGVTPERGNTASMQPPEPRAGDDGSPIYDQEFFLALARCGKDVWNKWRAEYEGIRVTFANVDFRAENSRINSGFSFADPSSATLTLADRVDLSGATFGDDANLSGATFGDGADLSGVTFGDRANLSGATFGDEANLAGATFVSRADLSGVTFGDRANLSGATFGHEANLSGATFGSFADLSGATFGLSGKLSGATFGYEANLSGATFAGHADLSGATFGDHANLSGAIFDHSADLPGVIFGRFAKLSGVTFGDRADLSGATFGDFANLSGAIFGKYADLGVTFGDFAILSGATFGYEANLSGATFVSRADLSGATFGDGARLNGSSSDERKAIFRSISFARVRFLGEVDFSGRAFEGTVDFTSARFAEPPRFDSLANIDFHGSKIGFTSIVPGWTTRSAVAVQLRRLRKLADDVKNHDLERDLYIEERKAERGIYFAGDLRDTWHKIRQRWQKDTGILGPVLFFLFLCLQLVSTATGLLIHFSWIAAMFLYWLLADYGRSFVRPFLALMLSIVLFHAAYWLTLRPQPAFNFWPRVTTALRQAIMWPQANDSPSARATRAFALANAVPFVGALTLDKEVKERLICGDQPVDEKKAAQLGVQPCIPIPPLRFQALALLQAIVSTLCVFFVALALRNYFRMR